MRSELVAYRAKKEEQYTCRVKMSKERLEEVKKGRLNQVAVVVEQ